MVCFRWFSPRMSRNLFLTTTHQKHTRKQVNPIQYTQSKVHSPKRCCLKRASGPLCPLVKVSDASPFMWRHWKSNFFFKKRKEKDMFRMMSLHLVGRCVFQQLSSVALVGRINRLWQLAVHVYSSFINQYFNPSIPVFSSVVGSSHHVGVLVLQLVQLFALLPQKQDSVVEEGDSMETNVWRKIYK